MNQFLPPVSKFMIGFDLETFPNQSDTVRSGRYLGNGPITLQMTNTVACNQKSDTSNATVDTYNLITIV